MHWSEEWCCRLTLSWELLKSAYLYLITKQSGWNRSKKHPLRTPIPKGWMYHRKKKVYILMETLSAAFVGKLARSITMNLAFCFCISNKRLLSMRGTYFQNVSLQSKLLIKNLFSSSRRIREVTGWLFLNSQTSAEGWIQGAHSVKTTWGRCCVQRFLLQYKAQQVRHRWFSWP